jgi:hypothetical protein
MQRLYIDVLITVLVLSKPYCLKDLIGINISLLNIVFLPESLYCLPKTLLFMQEAMAQSAR